jgi:hypothetical protein
MSEPALQVEAARIPDRDRLVALLREHGIDARPVDEVTIEVTPGGDADDASKELLHEVEGLVMDVGAPFVPQKHEGVIYIRPPVS